MGTGIAESVAVAGKHALLYEPAEEPLARSGQELSASLARAVARGKLSAEEANGVSDRVIYTTQLQDLRGADAVIEAVTEDARVKGELFAALDEQLPNAQFLASNTSSIPIAELASWTKRPERVLGLHFFSPVPVMRLVEVVVALDTSASTVAAASTPG
jgi:3-hydroxybutyryl-CoA dehydrogenase